MSAWQDEVMAVLVERAAEDGWVPDDATRAEWALILAALFDPRQAIVRVPFGQEGANQLRVFAAALEAVLPRPRPLTRAHIEGFVSRGDGNGGVLS